REPLNVLLGEDVEANRILAVTRLEQRGHKVMVAEDGLQALEAYGKHRFDLILMDLQMPHMNGLTVTREIRTREAQGAAMEHIPIIALTAHSMAEDRESCLAAGMDEYVSKPIDFSHLFGVMAQLFPATSRSDSVAVTNRETLAQAAGFPELPGLDVTAGIGVWRDAGKYRQALSGFARRHAGDADRIRTAVEAGNHRLAEVLTHALKGAAGSLAANELEDATTALDGGLRTGARHLESLVVGVEGTLAKVIASCRTLDAKNEPGRPDFQGMPTPVEPRHLLLTQRIAEALEHGDALMAESALPELEQWLRGTRFEAICRELAEQVEEIQCVRARELLIQLVHDLGMEWHGNRITQVQDSGGR
ncbi:MAG: response regulator, partial [Magnetococcales bacterium]|nr:response regulator [Magnetococcales bacterium]